MAALQPLKFLTVNPRAKHTATVIFVHGLGDSGHGWKPVADMFSMDAGLSHIKWILPHAPLMRVTANMGMEMPSWFDILDFEGKEQEDEAGMLRAVAQLNKLIDAEVNAGIPTERIVLGGFSQGGTISLLAALTSERKLGGVTMLSAWLPLMRKIKTMATPRNIETPMFWGHGEDDPLIEIDFGVRSVDLLKNDLKVPQGDHAAPERGGIIFNTYEDVPHSTSNQELRDLREWLKRVLPASE
ncbi:Phospholipase/carboxylesterase [Wolfiporia cocos MD-104 SS10]|uniref:Acyl-protein thioesterase 1 n=1 Tax=Wolfiporia cocos (strain MD-104) TaxID=742152 RepID=A0A2H3JVN8_WOLCO|nr:Phospholipase/carboxylesterase [Wolfiporia cocos MD-104 SS10]